MTAETTENAQNEYKHIRMITETEEYKELFEELFGDDDGFMGCCQFWGDDWAEYNHHKMNCVNSYLENEVSMAFKKQVIETYGVFKAICDCDLRWGNIFNTDDGYDEIETLLYNKRFEYFIWDEIKAVEEEKAQERLDLIERWRLEREAEETEEEEEEEEEEVDSDTASDAETDEEN
jgi:hypothetical protein